MSTYLSDVSLVTSSQRKPAEAIGDPEMYFGDPSNPFFIATSTCSGSVLVRIFILSSFFSLLIIQL